MEQRVLFVRSVKVLGLFKHLFICTKLLIPISLHNIYVALPGFYKIMFDPQIHTCYNHETINETGITCNKIPL